MNVNQNLAIANLLTIQRDFTRNEWILDGLETCKKRVSERINTKAFECEPSETPRLINNIILWLLNKPSIINRIVN